MLRFSRHFGMYGFSAIFVSDCNRDETTINKSPKTFVMKKRYKTWMVAFFIQLAAFVYASHGGRGVAVVIDPATYKNCRESVDVWASSLKNDGLRPYLVLDTWGIPDSIRAVLIDLYKKHKLEGAVLIGDIPVPMIRDAHHLTSAFKMDPRRPWPDSSVPSDRFYDDFDLVFNYLKKDSVHPLYHYYSLAPDGPQKIGCDIYSARIKPPVVPEKTKYELISEFLVKAAGEKQQRRTMRQITYFAGHSYNSDCMVARIDEKYALMEQFGFLNNPQRSINYIDHSFDDNVKHRLLAELARKDLDIAILHHHGAEDAQLMNGTPCSSSTQVWLDQSKKFFRGKIRNAKDSTASKQYYIDQYNVPESWVNNAFDPKITLEDSLADAGLDIHIADLREYVSGARVIVFDACFNGSFHLDDYISGHYVFNSGSTMVVKGNSVNTLQDIWPDQLAGLLDLGVSVGNWAKGQMMLENHLIGDPTFRFSDSSGFRFDLNDAITERKDDTKFWRKLIGNPHPEIRSLAMKMLYHNQAISTGELLNIQKTEKKATIRLQAFNLIRDAADQKLVESIKLGLYDNYELLRRLSALTASMNGSPLLIDDIFAMMTEPGLSKRVEFHIKQAAGMYETEKAVAASEKALRDKSGKWYEQEAKQFSMLKNSLENRDKEFADLLNSETNQKTKRFTITALRNSCDPTHLDLLFRYYESLKNADEKVLLIEALGWYKYSWRKAEIVKFCNDCLSAENEEAVENEIIRTLTRLK
jgi:hypothetical protein